MLPKKSDKAKPNILMIMADQLRMDWLGCAGNSDVETPNIDSIAKRGIHFTKTVCNSPLCAPSRASLAAGVYPHRTGVLDNTVNFPIDQPTYYQQLRKAGYRVGVVGKTDLHKPDHFYGENGDLPFMYHIGFTDPLDTEGKMGAAMLGVDAQAKAQLQTNADPSDSTKKHGGELVGPYQRYLRDQDVLDPLIEDYTFRFYEAPVWYSNKAPLSKEHYQDAYIGRKACEFINRVSEETPWHLFVSFVGPHDPWDAPEEYFCLFENKQFAQSIEDDMRVKPEWIKRRQKLHTTNLSPEKSNLVKRHYAGMIKLIDDWVGQILQALNHKGVQDNTVVIFCSDHGEMLGDHGLYEKYVMYESSVRVPLIISDPRANIVGNNGELVELVDLYPTILDLAGVEYDSGKLDGKSLIPILNGEETGHKKYQVSELNNTRMIFDGKYKFIENWNDLNELYDLENDPQELNNLIEEQPDIGRELFLSIRNVRKQTC